MALATFAGSASVAQVITENFDSLSIPTSATPTNWTYLNIDGGSNSYTTVAGNGGGTAIQIVGENSINAVHPPGSYIVNDGFQAYDVTQSITVDFDHFIVTSPLGRAQGGTFMFGDIQTGLPGTAGGYLGVTMPSDSFGNRGGVIDGSGTLLTQFTGNQVENDWYSVSVTWTPTSGRTGDITATGTGSSNSWTVTQTGYTFDSDEAYFGFGVGDYFNNLTTANFDNIEINGTPVPEPSVFALLAGCFGLAWVMVRRRG